MFRFLVGLALTGSACAHLGFESESDVRIFPDRLEICFRCSPLFAWRMMGTDAPPPNAPDAQAMAKPVIEDLARGWVEVASGDETLAPESARCVFEVDGHIAVLLRYGPPEGKSLRFHLTFFDKIGELDWSKIRVYDQTKTPFERAIRPFVEEELFGATPRLEVVIPGRDTPVVENSGLIEENSGPVVETPAPDSPVAEEDEANGRDSWRYVGIGAASILLVVLVGVLGKRGSRSLHDS